MTRQPLSRSLRGLCTAPRAWRRGPLVHGFLHTAKDVNWGDHSSPTEDVRHARHPGAWFVWRSRPDVRHGRATSCCTTIASATRASRCTRAARLLGVMLSAHGRF